MHRRQCGRHHARVAAAKGEEAEIAAGYLHRQSCSCRLAAFGRPNSTWNPDPIKVSALQLAWDIDIRSQLEQWASGRVLCTYNVGDLAEEALREPSKSIQALSAGVGSDHGAEGGEHGRCSRRSRSASVHINAQGWTGMT